MTGPRAWLIRRRERHHALPANVRIVRSAYRTAAIIVLGLLLLVWSGTYSTNKRIVDGARAGCERSKIDRGDNADGWRTAQSARLRAAENGEPHIAALSNLIAAGKYDRIARGLEQRQRLNCKRAYPAPSLLPF